MKRLLRMLALLICLTLTIANAELLVEYPENGLRQVLYTVTAGDSAYFLMRDDRTVSLNRLHGAGDMETVLDGLPYMPYAEDGSGGISLIFTDGEALYGLNHVTGDVFTIGEDGAFTVMATLRNLDPFYGTPGDATTFQPPEKAVKVGDKLVIQCRSRMDVDDGVLVYDLTTGQAKRAAMLNVRGMCSYVDGKVLLRQDERIYTYDPVTDETAFLVAAAFNGWRDMVWHEEWRAILWQKASALMATDLMGDEYQIGNAATDSLGKLTLLGDTLLITRPDTVFTAKVSLDWQAEFTVVEAYSADNGGVAAFAKANPQVYVKHASIGGVVEGLRQGKADVVRLAQENDRYADAAREGLLLDLSIYPEVMAVIDELYPAFREEAMVDGRVYGVPTAVSGHTGWRINLEVMEGMGLTEADIPTNLVDLCAFATRWNTELADQFPQYTLLSNTEEYRERVFLEILQAWSDYCASVDAPLHYDDALFRQVLTAFESMQVDKLNANQRQTNPEQSEYHQSLLWTGCRALNDWTHPDAQVKQQPIMMRLTADTQAVTPATHLAFAVVSATAECPDDAVKLALAIANATDVSQRCTLYATCTEPVERVGYGSQSASYERELAALNAAMQESVNPAAIQAQIDRILSEQADKAWDISEAAITRYAQTIAPTVILRHDDGVNGWNREQRFVQLIDDYLAQTLTAEEFIAAMDAEIAKTE